MNGRTLSLDQWLLLLLRNPSDLADPVGPVWFERFMANMTTLGSASVLYLLTLLAAGYLIVHRKMQDAALLAAAVLVGDALGDGLKDLFGRERPDLVSHLVRTNSPSFPSSHAMNAAIVYLTIGAMVARAQRSAGRRIYVLAAAVLITLLVGISRVYLGVHWPTDVIAGWFFGALWGGFVIFAGDRLPHGRHALQT